MNRTDLMGRRHTEHMQQAHKLKFRLLFAYCSAKPQDLEVRESCGLPCSCHIGWQIGIKAQRLT